ncbi:hypothetical protein F511_11009 [Dorcoceras hygrometricum]|uniref:Uncharacterized protein n=1 Tax=Dorcoceras hygrometricum TaxID=472368 RepID=A0A2Z7CQJ5_9LAMI|nr:hypothetical protein F511_11009 [Dorcoceras hygrometricum]
MGCKASKLDNEDTVRRCKERRRLMKESVYARHHLVAAHSDYCRSLRMTGAALVAFASGESLSVSHHTPAVLLRTPSSAAAVKPPTYIPPHPIPSPSPSPSFQPTPPPPAMSTASSHHQPPIKPAATPSAISLTMQEQIQLIQPPPHRLRLYGTGKSSTLPLLLRTPNTSTICKTRRSKSNPTIPPPPKMIKIQAFQVITSRNLLAKGQWENEEEEETEREEVHCSEWDDHDRYSTTSSSSDDNVEEYSESRSDYGTQSNLGSAKKRSASASSKSNNNMGNANVNLNHKFSSKLEKLPSGDDSKSSVSWGNGNSEGMNSDRRLVIRHKDLAEIVSAIREYFDKAASAGEQVSEMLEIGRAQFDRSFKQLRKTVYHSSGMLSNLSSSWTSKPPLAVKYRFEPDSIEQSGGPKSLCSSLERLLAWEKKLYQEVKAREGVKIEHERKLSTLQSQEYRGEEEAKLDKTKASIKRLQSLISVTSQAVSTTSSAIVTLRDADLVPQLVELCHGFMYMWRSMNQYHEIQNDIVQQVRGLVNRTTEVEATSDLHKQATRDLESAVSAWHSSFCRLIKFQRDFVCSLHGWFKLTILPVNAEPANNHRELPEVFAFFDEWKLALDRLPDTVASEAIKSFINVVHSILLKQAEELKIKKRTETVSKELEKKASSLRSIEKKYYHSYSMVGIGLPDTGPENGQVLDARDPLAEKKAELATCQRRVEDEMIKHSKAVEVTRAMTLNNIQTGLPGVFQAMTSFSALITEALETVCTRSYAIK